MVNDYRNTKYCPELTNLKEKKAKVANEVKKQHPRVKDYHAYISRNDKEFKMQFMRAYNCKCGYCGVSIDIVSKEMFEIDHFVYEKSDCFPTKASAGYIENLVLACHHCNHRKKAFAFLKEEEKYFYPDTEEIGKTFTRDEKYYIQISDSCKDNQTVRKFYEQLQLGGEVHRIDFLLMNMIGLLNKLDSSSAICGELGKAIEKLRKKRNIIQ